MRSLVWGIMFFTLASLVCERGNAVEGEQWWPNREQIAALEKAVALPERALPIDRYAKYYTGYIYEGRKRVLARYVAFTSEARKAGEIYIVDLDHLPMIFDGGCGVVTLDFDFESGQLTSVFCNGLA
ncbi:MAG: hypothetical protein HWE25_04575 [Alphaproteobacteria bacterium]|nr:hypothetical protein [Alphaproteobacteria bacterium]